MGAVPEQDSLEAVRPDGSKLLRSGLDAMDLPGLIKTYPVSKWVIWAGAGISADAPSSLPLGLPLTRFALDNCCGQTIRKRIENLWARANMLAGTSTNPNPLGVLPRLESVLGDIDDVKTHAIRLSFDFLRGFQSFSDTPFNANHLAIARLVEDGATAITTNFDTCIEDALGSYRQFLHSRRPCLRNDSRVLHLHGTARDIHNFGATIRSVKGGLPEDTSNYLDKLFEASCLVLFIGYSASDAFDVNPYFAEKSNGTFAESSAAFIQHRGSEIPYNVEFLMRPFGARSLSTANTSDFLQALAPAPQSLLKPEPFEWRERFLSEAVCNNVMRVRAYLTCKLAFTLGVDVNLLDPDAYRLALEGEGSFDSLPFHKTLAYVCRIQGRARAEKEHDLRVKKTESDLLGYYYAHGQFRRALKHAYSVEAMIARAHQAQSELDWPIYVSMAVHCRSMIIKYFRNPLARRVSKTDQIKILKLLELAKVLSRIKFKNVRFVIQVATALRFEALLNALLAGVDGEGQFNTILRLYGEASSVAGFISTYRDLAIHHFLRTRYHGKHEMDRAVLAVEMSLKLAKLAGDSPSIKGANKMIRYFSVVARMP